jgi:hypothetical protein
VCLMVGGFWRIICECIMKAVSMEVEPDLVVARNTNPLPGASNTTQGTGKIAGSSVVA